MSGINKDQVTDRRSLRTAIVVCLWVPKLNALAVSFSRTETLLKELVESCYWKREKVRRVAGVKGDIEEGNEMQRDVQTERGKE